MSTEQNPREDPLGLENVDCEIRIQKLRREIDEVAGGEMFSGKVADCPPEIEETFLEQVHALETAGFTAPLKVLIADGFDLPPASELDDAALTEKLWELIHALAARRLFLYHTNHLSDRELYTWLRGDALPEETMGFGLPFGTTHLDVLGGCSDEDIVLQMRFYADDEERARWSADFPDFEMPPREKPSFDRDRHLPNCGC